VEAVERRPGLELAERPGKVHVAEDLIWLGGLVATPDQYGIRVVPDELEALEVGHDRRHHEGDDAPAPELSSGGARSRLQLLVGELEAEHTQFSGEHVAGPRGVVRDEAKRVAVGPETGDRLRSSGNRLPRNVEHPVDVQENAGHAT